MNGLTVGMLKDAKKLLKGNEVHQDDRRIVLSTNQAKKLCQLLGIAFKPNKKGLLTINRTTKILITDIFGDMPI